ncbi:MAG: hypothetical protein ABIU58_13360 [Ramlibacter sp.]
MKFGTSLYAKAGAVALVLAAAGTATVAQARSDVFFSIGANVAPGVNIGVSNAPYYYPPVYAAPYYVQPAPVYYQPSTYYVSEPVYVRPAPVYGVNYYYGPSVYYGHRRHHRHWN